MTVRANMNHARQLDYCSSGIRMFCKMYGLSFIDLVRYGLDVEVLIATGDTLAINMANLAIEEDKNNG